MGDGSWNYSHILHSWVKNTDISPMFPLYQAIINSNLSVISIGYSHRLETIGSVLYKTTISLTGVNHEILL